MLKPRVPEISGLWEAFIKSPQFTSAIGLALGGMAVKQFAPEGYTKYGTAAQKVAAGLLAGRFLFDLICRSHNPGGISAENTSNEDNEDWGMV